MNTTIYCLTGLSWLQFSDATRSLHFAKCRPLNFANLLEFNSFGARHAAFIETRAGV